MYIEKLEVKDEVLSGEPRYEIKDNNGNVIATNCSIELITSVLQEGTPLNKALFDKVDENARRMNLKNVGNTYLAFINYELYDMEAYT